MAQNKGHSISMKIAPEWLIAVWTSAWIGMAIFLGEPLSEPISLSPPGHLAENVWLPLPEQYYLQIALHKGPLD